MITVAICIALGVILLFALVKFPDLGRTSNLGLGPDWDCINVPTSEPVCLKRSPAHAVPP
jgi:hypothetical protein